jgi:SHS2 domain-containing protein
MNKKFELIEHTADIGIVAYGKTLEELFANSALGMYNIMCEKFHNIERIIRYENKIQDIDYETLLVDFLNDLLFQTSVKKLLFSEFEVELKKDNNQRQISFLCLGEKYDKQKHGGILELKAATFHNLKILKKDNIFQVSVIFDT